MTVTPNANPPAFEGWVKLELMGHRVRWGLASEVEMFGGKMLRIDVHEGETIKGTEFYGHTAIFCLAVVPREIVVANSTPYQVRLLASPDAIDADEDPDQPF